MGDGGKHLYGAILIFHPVSSHFPHPIPSPPYFAIPPAIGRYWPNIVTPLARSGLVNRFTPLPLLFFPPNISLLIYLSPLLSPVVYIYGAVYIYD